MNVNSKPATSRINYWLRDAAEQLAEAGIPSALLDAEIILAHTLRKSRTYLHAHNDEELSPRVVEIANARLDLRLDRTPIAYIIGHKEFYGRLFKVSPAVLIPRPESETIIELLDEYYDDTNKRLVDVGTGSGALAITAKLEHPKLTVVAGDIDTRALSTAEENATTLGADIRFTESDLFDLLPGTFDYVLANLPYVDASWERSPETNAEPARALFAEDYGLAIINRFLISLPEKLDSGGYAFIEADPAQHSAIVATAESRELTHVTTHGYIVVIKKL